MPLSALCVAAKLLSNGHEVKIHDERITRLGGSDAEWADEIMISSYTGFQLSDMYRLAKIIKAAHPRKKITLGGPHATIFPLQCIVDPYIDFVWTGYAERGEFDMPWHLINIEDYVNPATERFIYISSYSCPGQCTFCAQKTRRELCFLPMDKAERDIDALMNLYPFKECVMFDATLFTKPDRALKISQIMKKHNLKWICDGRADEICKTPLDWLDDIIKSGLKQITIGLESGSPHIIEMMQKGKNYLEKFQRCAEILSCYKRNKLKMVSGVIFGCPGETPDDLRDTISYIWQIKAINPNFFISTTFYKPLPDTKMADMCKEYGYQEPQTLAEWAQRGAEGHYLYNQFQDAPWIEDKDEYRRIYDEFVINNKELFI
ncbi:MAG: radical SAM protein [Eubacteriales bacterium]|nr:radical SAM protein [Eubacteriales bacterium]